MSLPIVAIVGRPNVGKSSLLNCLVGRLISIVDAMPGVTRDRVSSPCALGDATTAPDGTVTPPYVELVDTGGIGIVDADHLDEEVESQIAFAIEAAAVILFVVDAREGVALLDRHVAQRLRRVQKPVLLVANKIDEPGLELQTSEVYALGFGEPIRVSARHGVGRHELLQEIADKLAEIGLAAGEAPAEPVMKLAIVGKRNAGKSTFINALAGEQRVIVSEIPGTTRDSVDVRVQIDGKTFLLIDTAGMRKSRAVEGGIDFYSQHRALRSVRRADVVALMIDASVPVSQVDKILAGEIAKEFKPVVLVVNKWDLAEGKAAGEDYQEYFDKVFPELSYAPISLTVAKEAGNVRQTIKLAQQLFEQSQVRVSTPQLNDAIEEILELRGPSHRAGTKPPKIYYASQISVAPPTIVCFVNDARSFDTSYQRFLVNQLRERLPFAEVPIRLFFNERKAEGRHPRYNKDTRIKHTRTHQRPDAQGRTKTRRRPDAGTR